MAERIAVPMTRVQVIELLHEALDERQDKEKAAGHKRLECAKRRMSEQSRPHPVFTELRTLESIITQLQARIDELWVLLGGAAGEL